MKIKRILLLVSLILLFAAPSWATKTWYVTPVTGSDAASQANAQTYPGVASLAELFQQNWVGVGDTINVDCTQQTSPANTCTGVVNTGGLFTTLTKNFDLTTHLTGAPGALTINFSAGSILDTPTIVQDATGNLFNLKGNLTIAGAGPTQKLQITNSTQSTLYTFASQVAAGAAQSLTLQDVVWDRNWVPLDYKAIYIQAGTNDYGFTVNFIRSQLKNFPSGASVVVAPDGNTYVCILAHTSSTANQPGSATSIATWRTYWQPVYTGTLSAVLPAWAASQSYIVASPSYSIVRTAQPTPLVTTVNMYSSIMHDSGYLAGQTGTGVLTFNSYNSDYASNLVSHIVDPVSASLGAQTLYNNIYAHGGAFTWPIYVPNVAPSVTGMPTGWVVHDNFIWQPTTMDPGNEVGNMCYGSTQICSPPYDNFYLNPNFNNPANRDYSIPAAAPCWLCGRGNFANLSTYGPYNGGSWTSADVGAYSNPALNAITCPAPNVIKTDPITGYPACFPLIITGTIAATGDSTSEGLSKQAVCDGYPSLDYLGTTLGWVGTNCANGGASSQVAGTDGNTYICYNGYTSEAVGTGSEPPAGATSQLYWQYLAAGDSGISAWANSATYQAASGAGVGGSNGQAMKAYVDRAATTWGPQYLAMQTWVNNYIYSAVSTPWVTVAAPNMTYAQAAVDESISVAKAKYWGMSPMVLGLLPLHNAPTIAKKVTNAIGFNSALDSMCSTNSVPFSAPVDRMMFSQYWGCPYSGVTVTGDATDCPGGGQGFNGYYPTTPQGLFNGPHPYATGYRLIESVLADMLAYNAKPPIVVTQAGTPIAYGGYTLPVGAGTTLYPISIANLNAMSATYYTGFTGGDVYTGLNPGGTGQNILPTGTITTTLTAPLDGSSGALFTVENLQGLTNAAPWNFGAYTHWSLLGTFYISNAAGGAGVGTTYASPWTLAQLAAAPVTLSGSTILGGTGNSLIFNSSFGMAQ